MAQALHYNETCLTELDIKQRAWLTAHYNSHEKKSSPHTSNPSNCPLTIYAHRVSRDH